METRIRLGDPEKSINGPVYDKRQKVTVLYFDVTHLSARNQFLLCCSAVFFLFILYGYLQELIFTIEGFKPHGWYLTLVQFGFYSVFAFVECHLCSKTERRIPLKIYAVLAFLTLGTIGCSNSSLAHLNYPTQVIFKCCKLIPVMVGSIVIQKKTYNIVDYSAATSMCIGLTLFTLADSKVSPNFSLIGVLVISCALLFDSVIGNVQEKYMKLYNSSNKEIVLYSYFIGFLYLLFFTGISGGLQRGLTFCFQVPVVYFYAFLFSLTGYLGVQVVLTLVRTCGALIAVTVTTCRKAVSIVISFIFFAKPFTFQYLWGGSLVILGIYLNLLSKKMNNPQFGIVDLISWIRNIVWKRRKLKSVATTV